MFAYVIKRLLAGLLVVLLVSMMVFALFWYGPKSPAKPICDADRGNRGCSGEILEGYEERLGYNNPITQEYTAWLKGVFVGREFQFGTATVDCPAPCLGISYRTRASPSTKRSSSDYPPPSASPSAVPLSTSWWG